MNEQEDLLRRYEEELTHLRKMGGEFARKYPKIAGRLELNADNSSDPYVERLIESFAYLTARIRNNIEGEFPQIPSALMDILYPHYLNPVPSMAIARFQPDPTQGKLTSGYLIEKGTQLFSAAHQGTPCRFRTCYPVTLWPVEVAHASFETSDQFDFLDPALTASYAIRLRIQHPKGSLRELKLRGLRFFLNGELMLVHTLYRMLFSDVTRVAILPQGSSRLVYLPGDAIKPVGFGSDQEVLPHRENAHPQYRLLQEYFSFPEKFLFFDLDYLDRNASESSFDILFFLDHAPESHPVLNAGTFALGCTPVINLFRKTTEPIRLSHLQSEYPLVPDMRRESANEIYSIESVSSSSSAGDDSTAIEPFFSYSHHSAERHARAFWYARRVAAEKKNITGTEILLSIVNLDFKPTHPATQTVFAHTLCTNREIAGQLPAGASLQIEEAAPVSRINLLNKPTRQITPPLGGMAYWRLISHLSLNYLSLSGGDDPSSGTTGENLTALREILRLYAFAEDPSHAQQIMGIREMSCRKITIRLGRDAWRGFARGTEIALTFDESGFVGGSTFLLASVLNHFFALHASINSFTQLKPQSIQRERKWKAWPPMVGEQSIL